MTANEIPIIDTHQHLWDTRVNSYPYLSDGSRDALHPAPLPRVYVIDDYLADIAGSNVVASVHVQCGWDPTNPVGETAWVQDIADRFGYPNAIVAHADLASPDVDELLAAHAQFSKLRGIRQHVAWHEDPRFRFGSRANLMSDAAWRRGFALLEKWNLSFDLQICHEQADEAADLCRDFPNIQVIIGNLGMPLEREKEARHRWRRDLEKLAALPNVGLKISGIGLLDRQWNDESAAEIVLPAIATFGADRCMFGSDFPVNKVYHPYARWVDALRRITAGLPTADQEDLFHRTAARVYRIEGRGC